VCEKQLGRCEKNLKDEKRDGEKELEAQKKKYEREISESDRHHAKEVKKLTDEGK